MALKPLNHHYSMENPASIYDEEAMTAIELAGRTAAKVNETVKAFNDLEDQTDKKLTQQDTLINQRLTEQDNEIDEMLNDTMPAAVKDEFEQNINDGTFNRMVDEYAGELSARLDNLLGQVQEGSTSGDAELIDARVDINGSVWGSVGANMRNTQRDTSRLVSLMTTPVLENVGKEQARLRGWYDNKLAFHESTSYWSYSVNVAEGEEYYAQLTYGWDQRGVMCADAAGNVIKEWFYNAKGGGEENFETKIVIPAGGVKLYVASGNKGDNTGTTYGDEYPMLMKVVGYDFNNYDILTYLENINGTQNATGRFEAAGVEGFGMLMEDGKPNTANTTGQYKFITVEVDAGETYHIEGAAHLRKYTHIMYNNADYPCIFGQQAENTVAITSVSEDITIPIGVRYLRVAGLPRDGKPPVALKLVERSSGADGWKHLKWCCVGDSLTEINARTSKHYFDYVQDKTGIAVVNMGLSGTGYKNGEGNSNAFYQRIKNVPTDADVVTIFGSGNDGATSAPIGTPTDTGTSTLCGCINTALDNLFEIMPTVKVGLVSPTPWGYQTPDDEDCFMYQYSNAMKAICERRGVPFLDLFRLSTFRTMKDGKINTETHDLLFSNDPVGNCTHPNELGHKMISSHFYAFVQSLIGTY